MTTFDVMLKAIKSVLLSNGDAVNIDWRGVEPFDWEKLYRMAEEQHVTSIVGCALRTHPDFDRLGKSFDESISAAMIREDAMRLETSALNGELVRAGVDFCQVKGIVLKDLYPKPWMRHMNDADYIIRPEQMDEANDAAIRVGYIYKDYYSVHHVFYSPTNMYELEMHDRLLSDYSDHMALNDKIWERMEPCRGGYYPPAHYYHLTPEMTIVYHIAHADKHLRHLGITVKEINDLYFIERAYGEYLEKAKAELADMRLIYLYDALHAVANAWYAGGEMTRDGQALADRIIGDEDAGSALQTSYDREHMFWKIRKVKYKHTRAEEVVFPSMAVMREKHPILDKYPAMVVIFWIKRIITAGWNVIAHYARMARLRLRGARAWGVKGKKAQQRSQDADAKREGKSGG